MPVPADKSGRTPAAAAVNAQNRQPSLRIVIVNEVFHPDDNTPDALLDRFATLTGWAKAIRSQGADVLVCQRFRVDAELVRNDVVYRFVADSNPPRPSAWFAGSRAMRAVIASFEPSVVHVNGMQYPVAIRQLRRVLPASPAIVVQDHGGFDPNGISRVRRWWVRCGLAAARTLLVATPPQIAEFRASGLVPDDVAIRDVMESSTHFRPLRLDRRSSLLKILWVGRLNANKDPLTVLEGFARFAVGCSNATLTYVYGTNELEAELQDAIRRFPGLSDRVRLVGSLPHEALEAIYGEADVFVLGSRREGSGYAAIEAMACGVVPVLTNIPSFRGLTNDGRVGALWEPGDPVSLASALAKVTNDAEFESQRDACRKRFEACFSWEAIGARAVAVYRECSAR